MRDDLLVDADADAQVADADAHVAALVVVAGTLAITGVIGSVARLWCHNAVCFSPARASALVRKGCSVSGIVGVDRSLFQN